MKNILIVSGHTDLNNSVANKTILHTLQNLLPSAEFDLLDQRYPGFRIDVPAEQAQLVKADVVALQFPLFWYGVPSLLKRWIEDTFVFGFSHGDGGDKLHGKALVASFTSGAPEDMYRHGGLQGYPIEDFLPPLKQLAALCGMRWAGHVYTGGVAFVSRSDPALLVDMRTRAADHAQRLAALLNTL
ncbi:NAD(P)H-dependent oxidoreductase [Ottowia sp.]|uniref:NAD(P)H-dependent oxidoreductase n=1 Tax=Ottowia sp. TaxID=1898956 RepID=UPI003A8B440D